MTSRVTALWLSAFCSSTRIGVSGFAPARQAAMAARNMFASTTSNAGASAEREVHETTHRLLDNEEYHIEFNGCVGGAEDRAAAQAGLTRQLWAGISRTTSSMPWSLSTGSKRAQQTSNATGTSTPSARPTDSTWRRRELEANRCDPPSGSSCSGRSRSTKSCCSSSMTRRSSLASKRRSRSTPRRSCRAALAR
eukprot:scaffold2675_cov236-Pinguiococcus_pyrenoidosus.AAC.7